MNHRLRKDAGPIAGKGLSAAKLPADNDACHGPQAVDGLIFTGPTGTNVNDVAIALIGEADGRNH